MNAAMTRRLSALGRAELTLLARNRSALFMAAVMPVGTVWLLRGAARGADPDGTDPGTDAAVMTGGIGVVLIFVVYANLVAAYVARREELVLKRLRTGEAGDGEILVGTALPAAGVALAQCLLLAVTGVAMLGLDAPRRPDLLVAGVLLGLVLLSALAAASTGFTRTVESAQVTVLPLMLVSFVGSGLAVPLEVMPDRLADVCRFLPVTPVVDLARYGWLGDGDSAEVLRALALAVAWTVLAVFAVRRWFRWEPRR